MNNNFTKKVSLFFCTFFLCATIVIGQCPDPETLICDDFESYTLDLVSAQSAHWTPWGGIAGAGDDAIVSNAFSASSSQSLLVSEANGDDMLLLLGDQTDGVFNISWNLYIPSGKSGYFNTQKYEGDPGGEFGMQVEFFTDGTATLDAGASDVVTHNWVADTWMDINLNVDLTNDWIIYTIDGVEIYAWPASWGTFDQMGLKQLGSINFFGNTDTEEYIDDIVFEDLTEPTVEVSFNVNMANETVAGDGVYISGEMNNWGPEPMIDIGNGTWTKVYDVTVGDTVQYLFQNGSGNSEVLVSSDCAYTGTSNRYVEAGDMNLDLDLVCYTECADCIVGIDDLAFASSISLTPNPAKQSTNLLYDFDQASDLKINLMNNLGQQIDNHRLESVQSGNYSILLDKLTSGIYFIHITDGENSVVKKLMIE